MSTNQYSYWWSTLTEKIDDVEEEIERYFREVEEELEKLEKEAEPELTGEGLEESEAEKKYRMESFTPPTYKREHYDIDYCLECLEKHLQTAKVLMREAIQRKASGEPTENVLEKIRGVVEELAGAEDDSNTMIDDDVRMLNTKIRGLRKEIWRRGLSVHGGTLRDLNEVKRRIDELLEETYRVAEKKKPPQISECPWCNDIILTTCRKLPADRRPECYKAFRDLLSSNEEEARRGAEKLKELGVFQEAYRMVKEIAGQLGLRIGEEEEK